MFDKKREEEKAAEEALENQKVADQKIALEQQEAEQQQAMSQNQANIAQALQQEQEAANTPQQQNNHVPMWMKNAGEISLKFERDKFVEEEVTQGLTATLKDLQQNNVIKGFENTENGVKAFLQGGKQVWLDLESNTVSLNGSGQNVFDAATAMVAGAKGKGLDISNLNGDENRLMAWNSATNNNLNVSGLNANEENKFNQELNAQKMQPTPPK